MVKEKAKVMLKIVLYQFKPIPDGITENLKKLIKFYHKNSHADLILTPELAICGYSPLDYLFNFEFQETIKQALSTLQQETTSHNTAILIGTPLFQDNTIYNGAVLIQKGKIIHTIYKNKLPNHSVFNENRYFSIKENTSNIITIKNTKVAIFICEDMWHTTFVEQVLQKPVDFIISINASPFEINKNQARQEIAFNIIKKYKIPLIYLNLVGGIDNLVFDGSSFVLDNNSKIVTYLNHAQEDSEELTYSSKNIECKTPKSYPTNKLQLIYNILILGLQDFIKNTGNKGVILGISGGIDSTLSTAIAVDALGSEYVMGISMPSKFTSSLSQDIISQISHNFKIKIHNIPINSYFESYEKGLHKNLSFTANNVAENLQARIRGNILMAFANNFPKYIVLTTGNKSELATGYSTLYGDTCGAFNLLKDLYKTDVFALAKWRNENLPTNALKPISNPIPAVAITRKPSAELKPNQFDEDSLMNYNTLDKILYALIEKEESLEELYKVHQKELVNKVVTLLNNSQYKREQSAIGIKISSRSFSKEYYYNISSNFNKLNYNNPKKL